MEARKSVEILSGIIGSVARKRAFVHDKDWNKYRKLLNRWFIETRNYEPDECWLFFLRKFGSGTKEKINREDLIDLYCLGDNSPILFQQRLLGAFFLLNNKKSNKKTETNIEEEYNSEEMEEESETEEEE
ncbi:MAG: hypothetical protein WC942_09160 [Clostridia bacterium]|jgi:hypothetical protein